MIPNINMDVTAALAGRPCIDPGDGSLLDAEQALTLSEDIRSAALIAAQLANEREHERSYRKATKTVVHGDDPADLIRGGA